MRSRTTNSVQFSNVFATSSRPARLSLARGRTLSPLDHATTTTSTTQLGEASSSTGGGYQTAPEQGNGQGQSSSEPNMRSLLREIRKIRKELKCTLPHYHAVTVSYSFNWFFLF